MIATLASHVPAFAHQAVIELAQVSARPDSDGLPGASTVQKLVNGLFFFTLMACLAGFFLSVMTWAIGARAGNSGATQNGKVGTLLCAGGALVAGAGPAIINFFFDTGQTV